MRIAMMEVIRDALIELSPADKDKFTQKASQLTNELKQLNSWINQQIQTIPQITQTGDNPRCISILWTSLWNGDRRTLIGISTEEQPSAQTVQRLVESVKKIGVPAIFAETTINPALIKTVAQEAGVTLAPHQLYSDSIGAKGSDGETYIKMMEANTRSIVEALGGKYTPFKPKK